MSKKIRCGIILRSDAGGLGTLSLEFYRHLPFLKGVVLSPFGTHKFENKWKFPNAQWVENIDDSSFVRDFLKNLDLLLTFETPYNWEIFNIARNMGVKTILIPNFEWEAPKLPVAPDLCICPTMLDYQEMLEPKIFLPIPINRKILPFKLRKKANVFLHNIGKGGVRGRNATMKVLKTLPLIKKPIKVIMYFQPSLFGVNKNVGEEIKRIAGDKYISGEEFSYEGKILKFQQRELLKYQDLYKEGDVLIHLQEYGSLSLPVQEALSIGMPIIAVDKFPENEFLPRELLVKPVRQQEIVIRRKVLRSLTSPEVIAEKIDEIANKPIEKYSNYSNELAKKWSWKNLRSNYLEVFENLIKKGKVEQTEEERQSFFIPEESNKKNFYVNQNLEQDYNLKQKGKYIPNIRIGSIVRADNTGLGTLAYEFFNHFNMKVLIIENKPYEVFPERFSGCQVFTKETEIADSILDKFLDQIDLLLIFQHPFITRITKRAKEKGKKIIWIPMYECMPSESSYYKYADFFICPSLLDYKLISGKKIFLPIPVNRELLSFKLKKRAKIFLHVVGTDTETTRDRNGTRYLLKAIPLVKNQKIKFLIRSQSNLGKIISDSRIILKIKNLDNYWELFKEGDVFLFPLKYNGLCLPIQEAVSVGMPIMATDFPPFNSWLPKEMLIEPIGVERITRPTTLTFERDEPRGTRTFYTAIHSPEIIAKKIDEVSKMNISKFSKLSNIIADKLSWEKLGPKYAEIFDRIVRNKNLDLYLFLNY